MVEIQFTGPTFSNDGGPLITLPDHAVSEWRGSPDGAISADYARACSVDELVGAVAVGESTAVVIGSVEGICSAQWLLRGDGSEACLVAWLYGETESEQVLRGLYPSLSASGWIQEQVGVRMTHSVVLMHAADPGADTSLRLDYDSTSVVGIGSAVPVPATEGLYDVSWRFEELPDGAACILCRWKRSA